ncbi:coiled-coil domain-containing protein 60-like isoform X2 [Babylonia areolata]|uniref:coiled-coil domain-containing protein 60-like isoform X2 n=1 Tax=Babylonia areolata TaxID=304850 RepID=UPI003FD1AF9E
MPTRDPRSYIRVVPLPIGSQKGVKIQARSIEVYNPTEPDRDRVRRQNYVRRSAQLTGQGFRAANHKPYHGLGDPFYLDEKKMILHALGQWDESQEWETSSSSEDEDSPADIRQSRAGHMSAAKFVLRRTRKDLNTLSKEVVKGRQMIRNVRLGHGLFDLIRQERMTKKTAAMLEKQRKLEAARNTWQPPKRDSDSEDTDEDIIQDDGSDLDWLDEIQDTRPSTRASGRESLTFDPDIKDSASGYSSGETCRRSSPSSKKKKSQMPRPYTPQHNTLCDIGDHSDDQHALFRQLCALNWILDAMNLETGYTMSSIMTCWSHNEIGGSKMSVKKAQQEKQAETRWERFLSTPLPGKIGKKSSTARTSRHHLRQSLRHFNPRTSIQSTSPSPSSSSSAVNVSAMATGPNMAATPCPQREETIPEEGKLSPQVVTAPGCVSVTVPGEGEEEVDPAYSKSMFKFLDEYYDSLSREKNNDDQANQGTEGSVVIMAIDKHKSQDPERKAKKARKKSKEREKTPDRLALTSPFQHDMQEALGIPRGMRADKFVKPKPSAELLEFHEHKASNKYLTLSLELANKFKEVQDDKAMTLHDILEQMERERLSKCQTKYMMMQTATSSVHRALLSMRREGERLLHKPSEDTMQRKSSFRGNWYTDLVQGIPSEQRELWYYQAILTKLRKYGLQADLDDQVESTSKQSVYKFLKVLESLRDWEICSPDISAAIEFCRERIVDLSVEEYEEWFKSVFPRISRPHTAPATLRGDKDKKEAGGTTTAATPSGASTSVRGHMGYAPPRQVQSAFVRHSQR